MLYKVHLRMLMFRWNVLSSKIIGYGYYQICYKNVLDVSFTS